MCEWNQICIIMRSWNVVHTMLKHHAQNDVMLEMQKRSHTWSKAETFIHVAIQNLTIAMWSSNTELMITATNCVVCPIMHVSEVIICQDQLEIHCFTIMSWPLSWLIMSAHCILVQQKLDTCSIVFYIDQIDLSSWLRHPNLYRWILPLCVFSFNLYWPCLCSAFQCDVEGFFHQV